MSEQSKHHEGSCLYGTIRIEVDPTQKIFSVVCHCTICQHLGSAAGQALVGFQGKSLQVVVGEDHLDSYDTSEGMTRFRCRTCGALVYNQSKLPDFDFRDAPLAIFERDNCGIITRSDELRPTTHIFCAHQTPWLMDEDVVKFVGHVGMSNKIDD